MISPRWAGRQVVQTVALLLSASVILFGVLLPVLLPLIGRWWPW